MKETVKYNYSITFFSFSFGNFRKTPRTRHSVGERAWSLKGNRSERHSRQISLTSQCHDFDQEYPLQKFISIRCLQIHTCFFHNNRVSVTDLFLHIKCWRNSWVYLTSNQRNAQNIRTTESVSGPKEWQHKYTQKWKKYMYPTLLLIDSSFTF